METGLVERVLCPPSKTGRPASWFSNRQNLMSRHGPSGRSCILGCRKVDRNRPCVALCADQAASSRLEALRAHLPSQPSNPHGLQRQSLAARFKPSAIPIYRPDLPMASPQLLKNRFRNLPLSWGIELQVHMAGKLTRTRHEHLLA